MQPRSASRCRAAGNKFSNEPPPTHQHFLSSLFQLVLADLLSGHLITSQRLDNQYRCLLPTLTNKRSFQIQYADVQCLAVPACWCTPTLSLAFMNHLWIYERPEVHPALAWQRCRFESQSKYQNHRRNDESKSCPDLLTQAFRRHDVLLQTFDSLSSIEAVPKPSPIPGVREMKHRKNDVKDLMRPSAAARSWGKHIEGGNYGFPTGQCLVYA